MLVVPLPLVLVVRYLYDHMADQGAGSVKATQLNVSEWHSEQTREAPMVQAKILDFSLLVIYLGFLILHIKILYLLADLIIYRS